MIQEIENNLKKHLEQCLPDHDFAEVLSYATLPAGKLFRPQLAWSLAKDLGDITEDHKYFASSIEIHHAYTLVHDDLPAMDDDDQRRGKASTHKKFNEWKAILAGDSLLNASFGLLGNIQKNNLAELLTVYSEYTGAKGLILGQVLDLEDKEKSFEQILKIHTLKTSRLIQLSLVGSNLLSGSPIQRELVDQVGLSLGIVFQLLDDLSELGDELGQHEKEINPFLNFDQSVIINELTDNLTKINNVVCGKNLLSLQQVINGYLNIMSKKISQNKDQISKHIPDLDSVFTLL